MNLEKNSVNMQIAISTKLSFILWLCVNYHSGKACPDVQVSYSLINVNSNCTDVLFSDYHFLNNFFHFRKQE